MSKLFHPHAARTAAPLADGLAPHLPEGGRVLELGSGSGQHVVELARRYPALTWLPSEIDPLALASIAAYRHEARLANLAPPAHLDVRARPWPVAGVDVALAVRLLHVLPEDATAALFAGARAAGAARLLVVGPLGAGAAAPAPATPPHLAAWTVPLRLPGRAELTAAAAAAGLRWAHDERLGEDTLVVFA